MQYFRSVGADWPFSASWPTPALKPSTALSWKLSIAITFKLRTEWGIFSKSQIEVEVESWFFELCRHLRPSHYTAATCAPPLESSHPRQPPPPTSSSWTRSPPPAPPAPPYRKAFWFATFHLIHETWSHFSSSLNLVISLFSTLQESLNSASAFLIFSLVEINLRSFVNSSLSSGFVVACT